MKTRLSFVLAIALAATSLGGAAAASSGETQRSGGTIVVGLDQEADNLNPYLAASVTSELVRRVMLEGLLDADPDGNYVPILAEVVPSVENGGISEDGLTITYTLKEGLLWSDGTPLTSADVRFTWEAIMEPANAVNSQVGYDQIESIDTPDDRTVVLNFKQLYAPAFSLFGVKDAILPKHVLEGQPFDSPDYSRGPLGSGPFKFTQWTSGDSIIVDRNENYRDAGHPFVDRIIFKIIPSDAVGGAQLRSGEIDILWDLDESQIPEFEALPNVNLLVSDSPDVEYLGLNLSERGSADASLPHPILGDRSVREALAAAIDRKPIIDDLLNGLVEPATSPIGLGWAAADGIEVPKYDPDKARSLLEEAGWVDSDGDGIRERDGMRLSLGITTIPSTLRELTQQLLQQQFKEVGVELVINNDLPTSVFANWAENGKLKRGNFDILMDTWGADLDPDDFLSTLFDSSQIPSAANNGEGWNFYRIQDDELDAAIAAGRATFDKTERKAAYRTVAERIADNIIYLPLYKRAKIDAFRSNIEGEAPNAWKDFTWNAAEWSLVE